MIDAVSARPDGSDPIAAFYDRHPYPPPIAGRGEVPASWADARRTRVDHHLIWPQRPVDSVASVLVAGCGTSQAVRHALRRPDARVVGIDVSGPSLAATAELASRSGVTNIELRQMAIEDVDRLDEQFDHVVCTGVLHHLADPPSGLRALREVLAPGGALTLMVYARYGRLGVSLLQDYCRRLGVGTSPEELRDLVDTLREIPIDHPISRLLRDSPDFADDDALADALCNPREQAYSVPEVLALVDGAGLRFGRWERQAPYRPDCGSLSETPHARRAAALPAADQYALTELFRGTIARHTVIAHRDDDSSRTVASAVDLDDPDAGRWVPIAVPTAHVVQERLPSGAAAALLNRAHTHTDLVLFVDQADLATFRSIDGHRPLSDLGPGAARLIARLWRHDLVVIDATASRGGR